MTGKANFHRKIKKAWLKSKINENRIEDRQIIQFMIKNTVIVGQSDRDAKEGPLFRLYIWPFILSASYVMIPQSKHK